MIDRLEQALARVIDGGIAAMFRLRMQPAEIGRRLEHALLGSRRTSMGRVIGANEFVVALHPDDYAVFASWESALCRELENWLSEVAFRHGVAMLAAPHVVLESNPSVGRRVIHVEAAFSGSPVARTPTAPFARLIPLAPPGSVVVLSERETTVGRAPGNDLVISAAEVSREHAKLRRDGNALEVHDLGSRNGTWVNGVRVSTHRARSGDEVAFGTLRYRLDLP